MAATNGTIELDFSQFYNIIDGKQSKTVETRHGINPATGEALSDVPVSTPADVDAAVAAAKAAFPAWSAKPWSERKSALVSYADALADMKDEFANMLHAEQGKPVPFSQREVDMAIGWIKATADYELTEQVNREDESMKVIIRYTPLGVSVGIVPWNFPIALASIKIVSSLLTGCPIIVKPSPFTPYCNLKMVELAQKFFPPGVIQVLSGDDNLGPWLTAHPGPDKISFTGSTATGKKVMENASKTLKRVTLELGGNDPAIVCADADLDAAAAKVASFAFANTGQICIAIKRVYVHESIHDAFLEKMVAFTKTLKVGSSADSFLGPLQNEMQYKRVSGLIEDVDKEQLNVVVGEKNTSKTGYFINPMIVDKPRDDSRVVVEEAFGPIVPLLSWTDEDDVLRRVNDTNMGLGASVWSTDLENAARIARRIHSGSVWINNHAALEPFTPFGGHKNSGIGCEAGIEGLKAFCNVQSLYLQKGVPKP